MKILLVYDNVSITGGGSQLAVFNWLKNLNKKGVEAKILINDAFKKYIQKDLRDKVIFNESFHLNFLYSNYSLSLRLNQDTKQEILKFQPQIIHLNEPSLISLQLINLAKKHNIKVISSFHTDYGKAKVNSFPLSLFFRPNGLFNKIIKNQQNKILKKSDYITTPSLAFKTKVLKEINKPVFFLPYPINHYFFKPSWQVINKPKKIITISRLSGEKNIGILIEMMRFLRKEYILTIVGDGIDRKFLQNKVKELKLGQCINFIGWIKNNDLPKIIKNHHIFVSTSTYETFGITYIETLACGLPLIIFDSPVAKEIVPSDMAIFINSLEPKIWADQIINIDGILYQKLRNNIKKNYYKINQYNEIESTNKLIEIYNNVL